MADKSTDKPVGYEVRHGTYCVDKDKENDLIVIKEYRHFADGRREPHLRLVENMKRPLWLVKKAKRNFSEIQQYIHESELDKYESTNCQMYRQINRALGTRYRGNFDAFKDVNVFGCGASPVTHLKTMYMKRWSKYVTPVSTVAVLDTETDVVDGTGEIVLCSITMKNKAFCAVTKQYLRGTPEKTFKERAISTVERLLGDVIKERNIEFELLVVDNAGQAAAEAIKRAHEWKPDFLEFWNIDFDMTKMIEALEKYGFDLADVFSDPSVPKQYRFFNYRRGPAMKATQSGQLRSLANFERWHKVFTPSSFMFVCGMSTYYMLRVAKGKIPGGYSLEATLNRHLKRGKLKFDACDHLVKVAWHKAMQEKYPYEYIAYNVFDCIGVELLDEEIKDLGLKFNARCGEADYNEFNSGPTLGVNKLTRMAPEYGYRVAVNSGQIRTEVDDMVVGPRDWTMVLPSELIQDSGVKIISDFPSLSSLVFFNVSDLDISSTYPAVQVALNVAKSTTLREVVKVEGLSEVTKRRTFVNLIGGKSNHIHVCREGFGLPGLTRLHELYVDHLSEQHGK